MLVILLLLLLLLVMMLLLLLLLVVLFLLLLVVVMLFTLKVTIIISIIIIIITNQRIDFGDTDSCNTKCLQLFLRKAIDQETTTTTTTTTGADIESLRIDFWIDDFIWLVNALLLLLLLLLLTSILTVKVDEEKGCCCCCRCCCFRMRFTAFPRKEGGRLDVIDTQIVLLLLLLSHPNIWLNKGVAWGWIIDTSNDVVVDDDDEIPDKSIVEYLGIEKILLLLLWLFDM